MDAVLYDDLVSVNKELRHCYEAAKKQGDWMVAAQLQMCSGRIYRMCWAYEEQSRDVPQVQLSLLRNREGRRHDSTEESA